MIWIRLGVVDVPCQDEHRAEVLASSKKLRKASQKIEKQLPGMRMARMGREIYASE